MAEVTVSSKYQICIPQEIREPLKIQKGQKLIMLAIGNRIEIVPSRHISEMRGFLKGMSTDDIREEEDRF